MVQSVIIYSSLRLPPMTPETTPFLTTKEAAKKLRIPTGTLSKLQLPVYQLPGQYLYAVKDIEAFQFGKPIETPQPIAANDETLSREDFAKWIRTAPATVKHWRHRGGGPVVKVSESKSATRYPLKTVAAWLNARRIPA